MTTESSAPKRLGSYRLEKLLGRGGMGEVFLAWDERLERYLHVAVWSVCLLGGRVFRVSFRPVEP